jgi:hypothetical protein
LETPRLNGFSKALSANFLKVDSIEYGLSFSMCFHGDRVCMRVDEERRKEGERKKESPR